jgi:Raf kinase inhibitor-like YbhB/YbcL family protein
MAFTISSSTISDGAQLPQSAVFNGFGHNGENKSPDLRWEGSPAGTKSYAITVYDPDAPTTVGFWHWVLFNIPASVTSLPENAGAAGKNPPGSVQGYTDFGSSGYGGAAPPPGAAHHYRFTVLALDLEKIDMGPGTTGAMLMFLTNGHTLAKATITAMYGG